jgi:hypothetical protein
MVTSGFTAGFLVTGIYFGHFKHQGVKIWKRHKQVFCSKLTKKHDRSTENTQFWHLFWVESTGDALTVMQYKFSKKRTNNFVLKFINNFKSVLVNNDWAS